MPRSFLSILSLCLTVSTGLSTGLTLTQAPSGTVSRGSSQLIAWSVPDNVTLQLVTVDLYQEGRLRGHLGQSTGKARSFLWKVSPTAPYGQHYYVKVTGTSDLGHVAWANSAEFSIRSSETWTVTDTILLTLGVLAFLVCCTNCFRRRQSGWSQNSPPLAERYNPMGEGLPTTYSTTTSLPRQPMAATYPPAVVVNPVTSNTGYSGGTVAGAAIAGAVGGMALDEIFHHHSSGGDTSNFGGGIFGGDGPGDSGGGF